MNILGCLDSPSRGAYYLDGKDVSHFNDRELSEIRNKEIGFVFQSFYLLARSTALHNVELPLIYTGIPSSQRKELSKNALKRVGLGDRMRHKPNELSGGERQRVAIARALVNQPSLILADEPTGNLDSRTGAEIMEVIQMLFDEGHTIILVTHEESVATHAGRILRLRDGMIESDDIIKK
jgi:putative ABC transport system ATP-binding protein